MTNRYDLIGKIYWFVSATPAAPITPERLNPLIEQLATKLQNYVFEEKTISARLIDLDEPWNSGFTPIKCKGGWTIAHFDVVDRAETQDIRAQNFNHFIRGAIIRDLQKIELSHYKTTLRISKVAFP